MNTSRISDIDELIKFFRSINYLKLQFRLFKVIISTGLQSK